MTTTEPKDKRLATRPWDGVVDESFSILLHTKFRFKSGFDLCDRLSEAVWRYRKRTNGYNTPDEAVRAYRQRIEQIRYNPADVSTEAAVLLELWLASHAPQARAKAIDMLVESIVADTPEEEARSQITVLQALHCYSKVSKKNRRSGRIENIPLHSFHRMLGAIYEDGAGRKPNVQGRGGKHRGLAYRFAARICTNYGIPILRLLPVELSYRRRNPLK